MYELITKNPSFIEKLFHLKDYDISIISPNKRIIHKNSNFNHVYTYIPVLKNIFGDIINDLFKNKPQISYIIEETYDDINETFNYEMRIKEHPIFSNFDVVYQFRFYLTLELDKSNKNKINIYMNTNGDNLEFADTNPVNQAIFHIIKNYLQNDHKNYVKKEIISSINLHSFELNIV